MDKQSPNVLVADAESALTHPIVSGAIGWTMGITIGALCQALWLWLVLALVCATGMVFMGFRGRPRGVRCWAFLALVVVAAAWYVVRSERIGLDSIDHVLADRPQLVQVIGTVAGPPNLVSPQRGPFAQFSYLDPVTRFELDLESIVVSGRLQPVSGRLWVRISQADLAIRRGQRMQATGWLSNLAGPNNPGEFDFRRTARRRGISGRLSLGSSSNWVPLDAPNTAVFDLSWIRRRFTETASTSLHLGLTDYRRALGLVQIVLLGNQDGADPDMVRSFRRVGLAHLLAISGAHLGILLALVWWTARLLLWRPQWVAGVVLIVLGFYLLVVPARVPILRAALMSAVFCIGYASGRRMTGIQMLALSGLILLIWQPADLFTAGFQLSFTAVAALLLFARPVGQWIAAPTQVEGLCHTTGAKLGRQLAEIMAVSVVAFVAVTPLVAFHMCFITPLSVVISLAGLPILIGLLAVGYLKILLGLLLPSASLLLAWPLQYLAAALLGLVESTENWPGVHVELAQAPSVLWVIGAMGWSVALFSGWFARRPVSLVATAALIVLWVILGQISREGWYRPALRLNMVAVGDGSCYLVRLGRRHTLVFDCGSQAPWDIGQRSIIPALRHEGVDHIDTLMISHADLDHYVGALDLVDYFSIDRVLVPRQLLRRAQDEPAGSVRFLVEQLTARGLSPVAVSRGWHEMHDTARLDLLWPPANLNPLPANDTSLVLSVRVAGRRVLLSGDIQKRAIASLLDSGIDLEADVADLPHHGSFIDLSPTWLDAVRPAFVLQSCGPGRMHQDDWEPLLSGGEVHRLVTAERGMVWLEIDHRGRIHVRTFRQ